jgi:cholinesterase
MADVVVVTINYRLGALGFLSLKDKALNVPGNAALKDQLMALTFVKRNIQNFGGDPGNVTLFGQSAGGSCVSWHCASEQSRGFFQKAIIMAGCVLNKFSFIPHRDWAHRLAKRLGYGGGDNERDILEFLQSVDPAEIVKVQDNLLLPDERGAISMAFAPHIEPYETKKSFIVEPPIDLVRKAWSNDIDVLIGGTSNEGLMYLEYIRQAPTLLQNFKLESMVPSELNLSSHDPLRTIFAEKLRKAYYPCGTDPTVDELSFCEVRFIGN